MESLDGALDQKVLNFIICTFFYNYKNTKYKYSYNSQNNKQAGPREIQADESDWHLSSTGQCIPVLRKNTVQA